ncbi:MAG TPA: hypothetical protein VGH92_12485 [Gaiellaceae bacterium]|jgi:hypothetical protein
MRRIPPLAALLLVLVLAACGGGSSKPYTAVASKACFVQNGFTGVTTDPGKVGFIAAFAPNGGLQAKSKTGNVLTVAFADPNGVASTEKAFRRNAPASLLPHIADIMRSKGNAVLVWTVSPSAQELSDAESCLKS